MPKITIVGAGSHVFAQRLVTDILVWPSLRESTITLMDVNASKLELMSTLANKMVRQAGVGATVKATTDLRPALEGADYVAVSIRVGDPEPLIQIPMKYGVDQCIGDTLGPGGVFYFLHNAPAMVNIAKTMQELCPDGLMLNYTNPMVMLCWAMELLTDVRYVGLCHSVQNTARDIAEYIGAPLEELSYWTAGINHMAWFLKLLWKGQDAYRLLWQVMEKAEVYERDIVKFEILKHFGAFVSESSVHNSEYMPYFRRSPDLVERHTDEKMWGVGSVDETKAQRRARWHELRKAQEEEKRRLAYSDEEIPIELSHEFCTHILNAIETNAPYVFNGNVLNAGLITNLPQDAVVEVPILVDGCGLHPCYVGNLPPALAGLNRSNLVVQELAVKGFVERDREYIYRAVQMDPLTAAVLTLPEIRRMVDELFEVCQAYMPF